MVVLVIEASTGAINFNRNTLPSAPTPVGVEEGSQALKMPGKAVRAKFHGAKRPPCGLKLSTTAPL